MKIVAVSGCFVHGKPLKLFGQVTELWHKNSLLSNQFRSFCEVNLMERTWEPTTQ